MKKLIFLLYFIIITPLFALEINQEFLNQFDGIALKSIRKSETLHSRSTQREFNGIKDFREVLGKDKTVFNVTFIYLTDNNKIENNSTVIWYNATPYLDQANYRLKYKKLDTTLSMKEGDLLFLGKTDDKNLTILIIEKNSKKMDELLSLFNMDIDNDYNLIADEKIDRSEKLKPIIKETNSIYSDTSKLEKFNDIEIYKNKNTNKIVIVGKITKIKDGDTIVISNLFSVRMLGIDAPESKQICKNIKEKPYKCGEKATEYLKKLVGNSIVTCVNNGNEKYGRFLFVCKNNKHGDINKEMVRNGWALAYYSDLYNEDQQYARENKLGIWNGTFQIPSEWRKQNKRK